MTSPKEQAMCKDCGHEATLQFIKGGKTIRVCDKHAADKLHLVKGHGYTLTKINATPCDCQNRIKAEIKSEPSGNYDYVDEVLGLLRVARSQRDTSEKQLNKL